MLCSNNNDLSILDCADNLGAWIQLDLDKLPSSFARIRESAVKALENTPGAPKINTESIARLNKMQRPFFLDNNFPIVSFSLSILGIVITLVIIISVAIKQRIDSQRERNARDPILRLKELMRRAENVETLEKLLEGSST